MADTARQEHTPPGSWPHGKGKDAAGAAEHVEDRGRSRGTDPPEYDSNSRRDAGTDTSEAGGTEKPSKEDGEQAVGQLKDGLKGGGGGLKEGADDGKLKEVEPISLTDEEKEKLTPGGDISNVINGAKDGAQEKGAEAASDAQDKSSKAQKTAGDAADNVKDEAGDKVGDAKDAAGDKVDEAKDAAGDKVDEVKETAEGAADDAKDKKEELPEGEEAAKEAEDKKDDVAETAEGAADEAKDKKDELPEGEEAAKQAEEKKDDGAETAEGVTEGEAAKEGEEPKEGETTEEPEDLTILKGAKVNKGGNLVTGDNKVVGRIKEGVLAHLVGKKADESGAIWDDSGKIIGRAELIPENEREALEKETAPFESFPDAKVDGEGYVVTGEGERVGKVVEGDLKALRGMKVDADGDILSRSGNVVGKAERWEAEKEPEPEPEPEKDRSILAGKRVNKAGNVVDSNGNIFGRVVEGDPKKMIGRMCDKQGRILSESGDVIGQAEVVPEGEREGTKEGPFAELTGCTVAKDGRVVTPGGDTVGRLVKGDPKVLFGREVDEDGDVVDKNGNVLGKAERWEEPEVEKRKGPMTGRRVNKEGFVLDEDGNKIGKLTSGDLSICAGKEIDDDNDIVDGKGTTVGHVSLLADIKEEESPEDKQKREQAEQDKKLAQQMAYCLTQCLDKVKPICQMITTKIDKAERTPKEELDEEELVKEVRPLIEEGGKILQEANGIIRGLDPDGRIQANAKHRTATRDATPEEYHLADILKELTGTVTTTIDNAKKKIEDMPHAKKELSPLWGLLSEPLFQILAAVGLLLNGVLGLVGRLLSGLGLGGLVDSLLGGLGVKNILEALGIGSLTDSLTGMNQKGGGKKKKGGLLGLGG